MASRNSRAALAFTPALVRMSGTVAVLAAVAGCGGGSTSAGTTLPGPLGPASGVVGTIQSQVSGLTGMQVAQGMGGILGYAQTKLSPNQFSKVADAFPGSDALIEEGTKIGMPSEMTGITSLRSTLSKAGISPDQFNQMVPAMTDVIRDKAGPEVANTFSSVFK